MSDNTEIAADDIEATYRVLEHIRDEWGELSGEISIANDAHYIVQQFEDQHDTPE